MRQWGGGRGVCESGLKAPFNHSCSCHRLEVGFGTAVYAGVCGCRCGELIWTCLVWTEPPTPDSFGMPSHRLNSATGEQKWITHTNILWPGQSLAKLINLMPNAKLRSSFYVFGVPRSGIDVPAQGMPGTVRQWMKALGITLHSHATGRTDSPNVATPSRYSVFAFPSAFSVPFLSAWVRIPPKSHFN